MLLLLLALSFCGGPAVSCDSTAGFNRSWTHGTPVGVRSAESERATLPSSPRSTPIASLQEGGNHSLADLPLKRPQTVNTTGAPPMNAKESLVARGGREDLCKPRASTAKPRTRRRRKKLGPLHHATRVMWSRLHRLHATVVQPSVSGLRSVLTSASAVVWSPLVLTQSAWTSAKALLAAARGCAGGGDGPSAVTRTPLHGVAECMGALSGGFHSWPPVTWLRRQRQPAALMERTVHHANKAMLLLTRHLLLQLRRAACAALRAKVAVGAALKTTAKASVSTMRFLHSLLSTSRERQKIHMQQRHAHREKASLREQQVREVRRILGSNDHYAVLQLKPDCTTKDAKSAFRRLARVIHPDKSDVPQTQDAFVKLQAAHAVLSDDGQRTVYDLQQAGVHSTNAYAYKHRPGSRGYNSFDTDSLRKHFASSYGVRSHDREHLRRQQYWSDQGFFGWR